jgi:hypothetical protein
MKASRFADVFPAIVFTEIGSTTALAILENRKLASFCEPYRAIKFLREAANDYSRQYQKGFITLMDAILKVTAPELYSALEQWVDIPMRDTRNSPHASKLTPAAAAVYGRRLAMAVAPALKPALGQRGRGRLLQEVGERRRVLEPFSLSAAVTRHDAPASRRFLATPHRDPSVCPRSESRSARAAGEARSLEIPIGPFRWVDRLTPWLRYSPVLSDHPLAGQTPFCEENLEPASLESNFWHTSIFCLHGLAAATSTSDVPQDARPRLRLRMKGIHYGLTLIARPEWR